MPSVRSTVWSFLLLVAAACGPSGGGGDDDGTVCNAGDQQCVGQTFQVCQGGQWMNNQCPVSCDPQLGCTECAPGVNYCEGETVTSCTPTGHVGNPVETCSGSQHCVNGACVDPCVEAATSRSYIGCEYWAVDLDNAQQVVTTPDQLAGLGCSFIGLVQMTGVICHDPNNMTMDPDTGLNRTTAGLCDPVTPPANCPAGYTCESATYCGLDAQHSPFAVVVSNPQAYPVMVTIDDATGHTNTQTLQAGAVQPIFPQQLGFADKSLYWTMRGKNAYRIRSTAPVVAYQFNPLDNVNVFSNDASLLIPRTTFDSDYYAVGWPTDTGRPYHHDFNAYVTIVAWQDGTTFTVKPPVATRAGLGPPAVAAIAPNETATFTLDAFEVLNLEAPGGGDLTGTLVHATDPAKPVGVFSGTQASFIPHNTPPASGLTGPCCSDHLEEMMLPTSTWGKEFALGRSQVRLPQVMEPDVLRVVAQHAGTTVTFSPNPITGSCGTLGAGESCQVEVANDTTISASEPILVGHYLKSVLWQNQLGGGNYGNGDPSLALAVPVEQFRTSYAILVPQQYQSNYVTIVTSSTGAAFIDGADVSAQLSSSFGAYHAGRITLTPGRHTVDCPQACGIEVYGWSRAVSYMFAGGLDLHQIVVN